LLKLEVIAYIYSFITFFAIFSAAGIQIFARGIEIKMLTSADFKNEKRKSSVKPILMIVITSEIGTEIKTATRQVITIS
jgi:hypothetical protein